MIPASEKERLEPAFGGLEEGIAKISPWTVSIGANTSDVALRSYRMAEAMRAKMSVWHTRPILPDRPALLPHTDQDIVDLYAKVEKDSASPIDKKLASLAGRWRYAVERAEYEAAERLRWLCWTMSLYMRCDQEHPDVIHGMADVEAFTVRQYGVSLRPIPKEWMGGAGCHKLIELVTQWEVCSYAVRRGHFRPKKEQIIESADVVEDFSVLEPEFDFGGDQ